MKLSFLYIDAHPSGPSSVCPSQSPSHLFKERHGKLLVGNAVSGCADVFFGLVCNVEVNPHQDVFLQKEKDHQDDHLLKTLNTSWD